MKHRDSMLCWHSRQQLQTTSDPRRDSKGVAPMLATHFFDRLASPVVKRSQIRILSSRLFHCSREASLSVSMTLSHAVDSMTSDRETNDYLKNVFSMDPMSQSDSILAARNRFLNPSHESADTVRGRDTTQQSSPTVLGEPRDSGPTTGHLANLSLEQQKDEINDIRREFFRLSRDDVARRLDAIDLESLPGSKPFVERLQQLNDNRESLTDVFRQPALNKRLLATLKDSLLEDASRAGLIQETFMAWCATPQRKFSAAETALYIRDHHPALYEMQKDWLDSLRQSNKTENSVDLDGSFVLRILAIAAPIVYLLYRLANR